MENTLDEIIARLDIVSECGTYSPMDVAVALSFYSHNVSVEDRAKRLHDQFGDYCEPIDSILLVLSRQMAPTELEPPMAAVYVAHALEWYGDDAKLRNRWLT